MTQHRISIAIGSRWKTQEIRGRISTRRGTDTGKGYDVRLVARSSFRPRDLRVHDLGREKGCRKYTSSVVGRNLRTWIWFGEPFGLQFEEHEKMKWLVDQMIALSLPVLSPSLEREGFGLRFNVTRKYR